VQTHFEHKGRKVEIVPVVSGGFYCKWAEGETRIMGTESSAIFMAEKLIDFPDIYGTQKREEEQWW